MRIVCKEQRNHEWYQARLGLITASGVAKAMHYVSKGSLKRGDKRIESAADRNQYIRDLAWELIRRQPTNHFVSKPMEIGAQYEPEARIEYWQATGVEVEQTGFILHPTLDYLGCSPDGFMPTIRRGVEIKVPEIKTHENYIVEDVVPEEYVPQMQCNMLCCEYPEWDFVSYLPPDVEPDFPDDLRLFVKTLRADAEMHARMEEAATATMEEVTALVADLLKRYPNIGRVTPRAVSVPEPEPEGDAGENGFDPNSAAFAWLDAREMVP